MSHVSHELAQEFPSDVERIRLKAKIALALKRAARGWDYEWKSSNNHIDEV